MLSNLLTKYRGIVIFLFALPASFIYQRYLNVHNWYYRNFRNTDKLHDQKVREISEMVKEASAKGLKMCTARKSWQTISIRKATFKEDLATIPIDLRNILALNEEKKTLRVEPLVTMGDITHYLVPKGYSLPVLPEMDDLTIGGLVMGLGIEGTSHKYGFLFRNIVAYEMVLANGEVLHVTEESYPDLFHALPFSRGTLGFLVSVELKVIPIKPYVELEYRPYRDLDAFEDDIKKIAESKDKPEFIEGLIYSRHEAVLMLGQFSDKKPGLRVNPINLWYKEWFHTHAEGALSKGRMKELIPLRHYYHRHTPSVFFQLKNLIPFSDRSWYQFLFGWLGAPKVSLMKYTMTKSLRKRAMLNQVAQDLILPLDEMQRAMDQIDRDYAIYPMWCCPVRWYDMGKNEGMLRNPPRPGSKGSQLYVDLGIYGIPTKKIKSGEWNAISVSRRLELLARRTVGMLMLYADIFMSKEEFEEMFEHKNYRKVRAKYGADMAFPEVYDKVVPEKWLFDAGEVAEKEIRGVTG